MITLYQFPPAFDLPVSVSPYCAKLEAYFCLTGRAYQTAKGNLFKSPNKAVPYVEMDGELVADSREIIDKLEAGEGVSLDAALTAEQKKVGQELEDLVQHDLYFGCLYARFAEADGWELQKPSVKALVPWVLSPILAPIIRSSQVKRCKENGFASEADYDKTVAAVERVAEALGDGPFLFGDEPCSYDCAVWANVLQVGATRAQNRGQAAVRARPELIDYVQRLGERAKLPIPAFA